MLDEYVAKFYVAAAKGGRRYTADASAAAREVARWKERVREAWDGVTLRRVDAPVSRIAFGEQVQIVDEACIACGLCLPACPHEAIHASGEIGRALTVAARGDGTLILSSEATARWSLHSYQVGRILVRHSVMYVRIVRLRHSHRFDSSVWMAPTGTPAEIVSLLNGHIAKIMKNPEMQKRMTDSGSVAVGSTRDAFAAHLNEEFAKWAKVIQRSGAKVD